MKILRFVSLTSAILVTFLYLSGLALAQPCPTCPGPQTPIQPAGRNSDGLPPEAHLLFQNAGEDWQARRWEQAIAKYRSIIHGHPSTPLAGSAHMRVGLYLKYQNLWDEAVQEFERGISIIPGTRAAHDAKTSIACVHASRGMYDEAEILLKEVLAETKDRDQAKYCSGWLKWINILKSQTKQSKSSSCGPRALSMVLKIKGIDHGDLGDEIVSLPSAKGNQISMEELRRIAEVKGLNAYGIKATIDQLDTIELPAIALLRPGHYIVVLSVNQKEYKIIDPEKGERPITIYSKEILERDWTGYLLAFGDETRQHAGQTVLTQKEMESLQGGVCSCCPSGYLGGKEDYPNIVFDEIERPIKGCVSKGGMPKILINTTTFNLVVEDIDLSYGGLGPRVEIKRTYNSDDPGGSVFGQGWTFSYNVSLSENPGGGSVNLRRGSGKNEYYSYQGGGRYSSPLGVHDELTKDLNNGTYSLWIKREKVTQNFNSSGKLTSIVDRNGNAITFQYDVSGNYLTTITDAVGRITTFIYWEDINKVHTITDYIGREATFTYENENLKTTTDMAGNMVTYDYQTDTYMDMKSITTSAGTTQIGWYNSWMLSAHYLSYITDPLGNTRWHYFCRYPEYSCPFMSQYDTGIKDARGNWMYYYNPGWCGTGGFKNSQGNQTTFGYDGNCNRTSITNANGDLTTIGYNAYGDITFIKDPECAQQSPPCQTTFTYWNHGGVERDYLKEIKDPRDQTYIYFFEYSTDGKWNLSFITDPLNHNTEFKTTPRATAS
jgi:YD repeat-containing protein